MNQIESGTKTLRVLLATPGAELLDRGARAIARGLRSAGIDVIEAGPRATPSSLAFAAAEQRVDLIALVSLRAAGEFCQQLQQALAVSGGAIALMLEGIISDDERAALSAHGIHSLHAPQASIEELVAAIGNLVPHASTRQESRAPAPSAAIRATRLDHTALCVRDLDATIALCEELFGAPVSHREVVASQKVSAAFFDFPNGASLELVSPAVELGGNAGLERFLSKRGDGLHHLALRVTGLDALLERLAARGVPLIDSVSRPGARGHRVAFLHPKALGGTLLELVEVHEG